MAETIYGFTGEWFDPMAQLTRQYLVKVFVSSDQIEIYDIKTRKCFLKKSPLPKNLKVSMFVLGAKVLIHSRLMALVDYADPFTRSQLSSQRETSVVLVSPDAYMNLGKIVADMQAAGLGFSKMQMVQLGPRDVGEVLSLVGATGPADQLASMWTQSPVVAIEVMGTAVASLLPQVIDSLKARYAVNELEAAIWSGPGLDEFFFGASASFPTTAQLDAYSSCAVIRPHAVTAGSTGGIIDALLQGGFMITALQTFQLDKASAAEFLEVYQGVVPTFSDTVIELCSGTLVALEVRAVDDDVCSKLREFVGPWDVEMARELAPKSIRSVFGVDRVQNAIHVTDLAEDTIEECSYFFQLLNQA